MSHAPKNLRTKTPRPLQQRQHAASRRLGRAYRFGSPMTPTPPPVTVTLAADPTADALPEQEDPLAETPLRPAMSAWMWFALSALVCAATAASFRHFEGSAWLSRQLLPLKVDISQPSMAALMQPPTPAASAAPTSTWRVKHDGHVPIAGGVLVSPASFTTQGGDYDLIIHFHGDVAIVKQSVAFAEIDAAVAVINLGESSKPYREAFASPGAFEKLLVQIEQGLSRRGLRAPKLRRLALTSWSAGYGSIESILEHRRAPHAGSDPLDALIALDGIHCGYVDGDRKRLNQRTVLPFLRAAEAAADGGLLFSMTHSRITPPGYASTSRTAELLLARVGAAPHAGPTLHIAPWVQLPAAARALAGKGRLLPTHDTRVGNFRVQGFDGAGSDDHAMHLTQMGAIALPDLAKRWSTVPSDNAANDEDGKHEGDSEASDEVEAEPEEAERRAAPTPGRTGQKPNSKTATTTPAAAAVVGQGAGED